MFYGSRFYYSDMLSPGPRMSTPHTYYDVYMLYPKDQRLTQMYYTL